MEINEVNELIEKAFGKGYKGNYDYDYYGFFSDGQPRGLKEIDRLCLIGKKRLLGLSCSYAGQLGCHAGPEGDGSVIVVSREHKESAKEYARLYNQRTGKPVRIILDSRFLPSFDFGFNPRTSELIYSGSGLEEKAEESMPFTDPWELMAGRGAEEVRIR